MATSTQVARQHLGRAMGSKLHIIATGDEATINPIVAWAAARVDQLEQRWSRFLPTSDVSRMNDSPGVATMVSADTITLVTHALEARDLSGGRFDPMMLQAMVANGYDRTFVSIKAPVGMPMLDPRRYGFGRISVDHTTQMITVDAGSGFDPGGIGKGLAADLVAEEMIERGADGALVNIGGDIRCVGRGPDDDRWVISVGDTKAGVENRTIELAEGGVATSTQWRRRWKRQTESGAIDTHHLLDASTGRAADAAADLVTVIAGRAADAEWLATAIASSGGVAAHRSMLGDAAAVVVDRHGNYTSHGDFDRFVQ